MALLESDRKNYLRSDSETILKTLEEQLDNLFKYQDLLKNEGFKNLLKEIKEKNILKQEELNSLQQDLLINDYYDKVNSIKISKMKKLFYEISTSESFLDPVINSDIYIKDIEKRIILCKENILKLEE